VTIATAPLITIIIRRSYVGTYYGMSDKAIGLILSLLDLWSRLRLLARKYSNINL